MRILLGDFWWWWWVDGLSSVLGWLGFLNQRGVLIAKTEVVGTAVGSWWVSAAAVSMVLWRRLHKSLTACKDRGAEVRG